MAKYRIQACKQRLWYVKEYLYPSLLQQGIPESDITIWLDEKEEGCLFSCMSSFANTVGDADETTWYLQDDVIICSNFYERTLELIDYVVCGFCCNYDHIEIHPGKAEKIHMWYAFPCMGIPNRIANACANWFYKTALPSTVYKRYTETRKMDDSLFWIYMQDFSDEQYVINAIPNLVDHIDYLLGGSVISPDRERKIIRSDFWEEPELVDALERKIYERRKNSTVCRNT